MENTESRNVNVLFTEEVISAIDNFQFDYHIPSRTEAIRRLLEYGLLHQPAASKIKSGRKSISRRCTG